MFYERKVCIMERIKDVSVPITPVESDQGTTVPCSTEHQFSGLLRNPISTTFPVHQEDSGIQRKRQREISKSSPALPPLKKNQTD